jgi:endogenous inhibitor of DNA gyrase (YacG/DUF329 family)
MAASPAGTQTPGAHPSRSFNRGRVNGCKLPSRRANIVPDGFKNMPAKRKSAKLLHCPTCGMLVQLTDEDFPFCSDRCRKIDLGKWAMGVYKISSPVLDPEVLEDLGGAGCGSDHGLGGGNRGGSNEN